MGVDGEWVGVGGEWVRVGGEWVGVGGEWVRVGGEENEHTYIYNGRVLANRQRDRGGWHTCVGSSECS